MSNSLQALLRLVQNGDFARARPALQQYVARFPGALDARLALADCMLATGDTASGVYHLQKLLQEHALPDELLAPACDMLAKAARPDDAARHLETRRTTDPASLMSRISLGKLYLARADIDKAWDALCEAEAIFPQSPIVRRLKASVLSKRGDTEGAVDAYRACLWDEPDDINLTSALAFLLNGSARATRQEVYQAHVKFGDLLAGSVEPLGVDFGSRLDPDRKLRLAFLTHDAVGHSVSSFLEAPLRHLDRSQFAVQIYHTGLGRDAITERLASCCDVFTHLPGVNSPDLAGRVLEDAVDVLIELNGHTQGHRLHAMQLRPAPLQGTWLGYPNTTGLRAVDFRIVDSITDPPGAEQFATERLARLDPCFICYTPIDNVPERIGPSWKRPDRTTLDGAPVFCCFNAAHKVNDASVALWARVLEQVPGSTMLVKSRGVRGPFSAEGVTARFAACGLDAARLQIVPFGQSNADHLRLYSTADIQLDTFPYHGTTTTCESLLMGVPTVTLIGDRHVSRVGATLLAAVGLPELTASDEDAFVSAAVALARDTARLRRVQQALPDRVRTSALCDEPRFGAAFGRLVRALWKERCKAR